MPTDRPFASLSLPSILSLHLRTWEINEANRCKSPLPPSLPPSRAPPARFRDKHDGGSGEESAELSRELPVRPSILAVPAMAKRALQR